jgi:hypothetical protein
MVDYVSLLIGAAAVYSLLIHMFVAYLSGQRDAAQTSLSAVEQDVSEEDQP